MSDLVRLDRLLVDLALATSRTEAREMIESGRVSVDGLVRTKAATMARRGADVRVEDDGSQRWVSRGAHKLIKALDVFAVDPNGASCVDIGASTGGFTQVLLSRGAARVAAVDVGYGQLAWELRSDPRVIAIERTNARYITPEDVGYAADILTCDASFISLRLLLPNLASLVRDGGTIIALLKPQFEAGRGRAPKGVVRDAAVHADVIEGMIDHIRTIDGLDLRGIAHSPIKGPEGNIEFLLHIAVDRGKETERRAFDVGEIVRDAHDALAR